jgi:hypothetical protein
MNEFGEKETKVSRNEYDAALSVRSSHFCGTWPVRHTNSSGKITRITKVIVRNY